MQNRKFGMWKKIAVCGLAAILCATSVAPAETAYAAGSKIGTKTETKSGTATDKTETKSGTATDKTDSKSESVDSATAATVQLSKTEGTVTVSNTSGKEVKIIKSMRLLDGYHVATEKKSYAWEELDKSKLIKEDAVSEVEIRKSGKVLEVLLKSGNMFFNVTEKLSSDETLNICTSSMIAGIRGTCGWVKVIDKMCTRIYLLEGELECVVADPVTGQSKVTRLRGGQWADFYVYDKAQQGDKCDIVMETFRREDVPGFVLVELAGNTPRCQEIFEDSGIDLRDLTMEEALKRLKEDEDALEGSLKKIEEEIAKQENNISQDPVWEEGEKIVKNTPTDNNRPGNTPGSGNNGDDNPGGGGGNSGGNSGDNKKPSDKKKTEKVDVTEDADALEDLLEDGKDVTVGGDDTSNIYQIDSDLHIPEGTTLAIKKGLTLVVGSAATITVDGTLQAKGDMENNGRVIINSSKSMHVTGSLTNTGSIINQNQGLVEAAKGIDNYGTINCEGTSTMYSSSKAGTVRMCGGSAALKIAGGDITNKSSGAALALEEATQIGNITFSNETLLQSLTENVLTVGGKKLEVSHYGTSYDSGSGYHQFKIDVKTVTFQGGAGSSAKEVKVISGFPVGSGMPALAKAGYELKGWNLAADGSGAAFTKDTVVEGDLTVYAQWKETTVTHTVTFNANGGKLDEKTATVLHGGTVDLPTPIAPDDYAFFGWYTAKDSNGTRITGSEPITANVTYYARWVPAKGSVATYTVTFNANGGTMAAGTATAASETAAVTVNHGEKVAKPEDPARNGYVFVEWCKDQAGTTVYDFNETITADITIYAKWTQNQHVVTFDSQGGSAVAAQTVDAGGTASEPTAPTKVGYTFDGWYTEAACEAKYNFSTPVTADITLYAKWTVNTYTVTFNANGGTIADITGAASSETATATVEHGKKVTAPTDPARTGYTFDKWYTSERFSEEYDFDTEVTADITLYAKWTANTYTVTLNANSGAIAAGKEITGYTYGTGATLPAKTDITRANYIFEGWYAASDFSGTAVTAISATDLGDKTFYAKWVRAYTVTFNTGTGATEVEAQTVKENDKATKPTNDPTKSGYKFDGWYADSQYATEYAFTEQVTADITIYAKWTPLSTSLALSAVQADFSKLTKALEDNAEVKVEYDGGASPTLELPTNLTVAEGRTLTLGDSTTGTIDLTNPENKTLQVDGTLYVTGTMTNRGTTNVTSNMSLHVTGSIINKEGAVLHATSTGLIEATKAITNEGSVLIETGGTLRGTLTNKGWVLNGSALNLGSSAADGTSAAWDKTYKDKVESVTMTTDVKIIAEEAFKDCTALTNVELSSSVITIGREAFSGCTGLTGIDLNGTVKTIGVSAFSGCTELAEVKNTSALTSIGDSAFDGCVKLTGMQVPSGASVGTGVFSVKIEVYYDGSDTPDWTTDSSNNVVLFKKENTSSSGTITYYNVTDNKLTLAGTGPMKAYTTLSPAPWGKNITSVEMREGVTSIGAYAFYQCADLVSVEIPETVTYLGGAAFYGCSSLGSIELPDSINYYSTTGYAEYAFQDCTSLKNANIPSKFTTVPTNFFSGCRSLDKVVLPAGVTTIGDGAFASCVQLISLTEEAPGTTITLPANLKTIGMNAFKSTTSLTGTMIFGSKVKTIGDQALYSSKISGVVISSDLTNPRTGSSFGGAEAIRTVVFADGVKKNPAKYFQCQAENRERHNIIDSYGDWFAGIF